jgi:hypothetical protein
MNIAVVSIRTNNSVVCCVTVILRSTAVENVSIEPLNEVGTRANASNLLFRKNENECKTYLFKTGSRMVILL